MTGGNVSKVKARVRFGMALLLSDSCTTCRLHGIALSRKACNNKVHVLFTWKSPLYNGLAVEGALRDDNHLRQDLLALTCMQLEGCVCARTKWID